VRRFIIAVLLWCIAATAFAHEVRPAFLRAAETAPGEFTVVWKQPVLSGQRLRIRPTFPAECTQTEPRLDRSGDTVAERFKVTCDLRQGTLSLPGLENTLTDAFVEIVYLDEANRTSLLKPADPTLELGAISLAGDDWPVLFRAIPRGAPHARPRPRPQIYARGRQR